MKILGFNPGHDGTMCYLESGELKFSFEAEKSNFTRHSYLNSHSVLSALERLDGLPDVLAVSGWLHRANLTAGYRGLESDTIIHGEKKLLGKTVRYFSSSHERAHIFCSFGLSDLPKGQPFYALVWEGTIGSFYKVDEHMRITSFDEVITNPGERYVLPYALAAGQISQTSVNFDPCVLAGKVMALAAYDSEDLGIVQPREAELLRHIFEVHLRRQDDLKGLADHYLYNVGITSHDAKRMYRLVSDEIFSRFNEFARRNLPEKLPLVISGGCGLNCEWNSRWHESGLFESVFIPPCTNDSGVAIGTALDAQFFYSGESKIKWNVYAGDVFVEDIQPPSDEYLRLEYTPQRVAQFLSQGHIIAWVSGRAEIGPRALGARSLLAAPFLRATQQRLNTIKKREDYRPVAPICLEDELDRHFSPPWNNQFMLHFSKTTTPVLQAITHVDGSARVQSVNHSQHPQVAELLREFSKLTGYGVLCNTSLNFPGAGFINTMSQLVPYVQGQDIQAMVVDNSFYIKKEFATGVS